MVNKYLSKYRNFLHFFLLVFLGFLCLLLTKFHSFANPVPSEEYNGVFYFQFLLVFCGYCISLRLGRILLISGVFLLSRLSSFAYTGSSLLVVGGLFTGGIFGLACKIYIDYSRTSPFVRSIHDRFTFTRGLEKRGISFVYFPILIFLSTLLLGSFIQFFHLPFLTGTDVQDYFYFPEQSSRSLYSISANIILPMIYALLYFYAEERSFSNYNQGAFRDFGEGILYTFAIQSIVIFIQTFISIHFFAQGTNNAPNLGRITGLFRDAGSATWMYPLLLIYSLHYAVKELSINHPRHIVLLSLALLGLGGILGYKQGRAYNIILFSSFVLFHLNNIQRYKNNLGLLKTIGYFSLLLFASLGAFYFFARFSNQGRLWNLLLTLSTPEGIITKISNLDPPRTFLNQMAFQIFQDFPVLGGGVGSVTVSLLKNPIFILPNPNRIVDGPGSFYTGILGDTGILGTLIVLFWAGLQIYWRGHLSYILYLVVPLVFGYHVSHPDGAVFILLLVLPMHRLKILPEGRAKYLSLALTGISLFFLIKPGLVLYNEKKPPLFREDSNHFYQISYYSKGKKIISNQISTDPNNKSEGEIVYHSFKGKLIWKIGTTGKRKTCMFIGEETSLETIRMRWNYLDESFAYKGHQDISVTKYDTIPVVVIPEIASYVLVEELDQADFPVNRGTVYNVKADCFSEKNEFIGEISGL